MHDYNIIMCSISNNIFDIYMHLSNYSNRPLYNLSVVTLTICLENGMSVLVMILIILFDFYIKRNSIICPIYYNTYLYFIYHQNKLRKTAFLLFNTCTTSLQK